MHFKTSMKGTDQKRQLAVHGDQPRIKKLAVASNHCFNTYSLIKCTDQDMSKQTGLVNCLLALLFLLSPIAQHNRQWYN